MNPLHEKLPDDLLILPVIVNSSQQISNDPGFSSGHPFIVVIDRKSAQSDNAIRAHVNERMQRWSGNPGSLRSLLLKSEPPYGTGGCSHQIPFESLDQRRSQSVINTQGCLLKENDVLYCEVANVSGSHSNKATPWQQMEHAEYTLDKKVNARAREQVVTLENCLDAFTTSEQLGDQGERDSTICSTVYLLKSLE